MSKSPNPEIIIDVLGSDRMTYNGFAIESVDSTEPLTRSEVGQLRHLLRWDMSAQRRGFFQNYSSRKQCEALTQIADSLIEQAERDAKKSPIQRLKETLDRTAAEAADESPAGAFTAKDVKFLRWFRRTFLRFQSEGRRFVVVDQEESDAFAELIDERVKAKTATQAADLAESIEKRVEAKRKAEAAASTPPAAEATADIGTDLTPYMIVHSYNTGFIEHTGTFADPDAAGAEIAAEFLGDLPAIVAANITQISVHRIDKLTRVHTYIAPKSDDHATATEDQASS